MMNSLVIFTCLLAIATTARGQNEAMEKYLSYLKPYITTCAEKHKFSADSIGNVQRVQDVAGAAQLGCFRACVMQELKALADNKVQLDPVLAMIETVHAGDADEITRVKKLATDCSTEVDGLSEECDIGMKYTDCYIGKLME